MYLISEYDNHTMYVQAHLAILAHYPCPLMAQLASSLGEVYSCMLLQIVTYFWGQWGTNWGIDTFPCRLPKKANICLDNGSRKMTVDEILTII